MNQELEREITKQIGRFENRPGVEQTPQGALAQATELRRAFREVCRTPDDAEGVGDALMRIAKFFPMPWEVHESATRFAEAKRAKVEDYKGLGPLNFKCPKCRDTGKDIYTQGDYEFVRKCDCQGVTA